MIPMQKLYNQSYFREYTRILECLSTDGQIQIKEKTIRPRHQHLSSTRRAYGAVAALWLEHFVL